MNSVGTENYQTSKAEDYINYYSDKFKSFFDLLGQKEYKNY